MVGDLQRLQDISQELSVAVAGADLGFIKGGANSRY